MGKREEEGAGEAGLRAHRATRLGQGAGVGTQVNSAETLQHLDACLGKRLTRTGGLLHEVWSYYNKVPGTLGL